MAEHFNVFFSLVGKEIQDNLPPSKNIFENYLKTQNPNKIISDIIQALKLNKSTGPNSLSVKYLKSIKGITSVLPCELKNKSFTSCVLLQHV